VIARKFFSRQSLSRTNSTDLLVQTYVRTLIDVKYRKSLRLRSWGASRTSLESTSVYVTNTIRKLIKSILRIDILVSKKTEQIRRIRKFISGPFQFRRISPKFGTAQINTSKTPLESTFVEANHTVRKLKSSILRINTLSSKMTTQIRSKWHHHWCPLSSQCKLYDKNHPFGKPVMAISRGFRGYPSFFPTGSRDFQRDSHVWWSHDVATPNNIYTHEHSRIQKFGL